MIARVENPPNPWSSSHVDWLGEPPTSPLEVYFDHTRDILSTNDSPDIPFRYGLNPYRGCFHGCAYCYARPTHEYLSFGAGTDFERKIVVKPDAPELLAARFARKDWTGELICLSGNTDCYQPLEAVYRLTRRCLEVCADWRNPVGIITKSPLVERDIDVLRRMAYVCVTVSVPFIDPVHARAIEPYVPPPARRIEAIRRLAEAGVAVGVNVAPVIPGLSDSQMAEILERCREAGAQWAGTTLLRLPGPVAQVFEQRLRRELPDRAERVLHRIQEARGGKLNDPRFKSRMRGEGEYADMIRALFERTRRKLGYGEHPHVPDPSPFRRPMSTGQQLGLFSE